MRRGGFVFRRGLALAALASALIATVWLLFAAGSSSYVVKAVVDDAGQLVSGNEVQIGGVAVGKVSSIELRRDDHLAELGLEIDGDAAPLHEGTTATIRNPSLTSVAGRYVTLLPGPNDAPEIPDGGEIGTEDTSEIVDLDQLLNSLDPRTVAALSQVVRGSTEAARGRGDELGEAIESLNPALSRSAVTLGEITRDQRALEQLVVSSADVVETLASRRSDLSSGTTATAEALGAIAEEREALSSSIAAAPAVLRQSTPTVAEVRALLGDLDPAIAEAEPVARGLRRLMPSLRPASARLRSLLPAARRLVRSPGADDDATDLLRRVPPLAGHAVPLLGDLTKVGVEARPVLEEVRPYIPELTSGIVAGFGGSPGGYYDANGHYARISFLGGPFSLIGLAPGVPNLGALQQDALDRCPGGATTPTGDGSNPFVEPALECDPALTESTP